MFVTDPSLKHYNAAEKSAQFHDWIQHQRKHYMANDILITMGDDFRFNYASYYFENSDRLIQYYNENEGAQNNIRLIYSTPSMYVAALAA